MDCHILLPFLKDIFINEVVKYFTIIKCEGMLDGLLEGLKYYEVLQYIKQMCSKILIKMFLNLKMTKKVKKYINVPFIRVLL